VVAFEERAEVREMEGVGIDSEAREDALARDFRFAVLRVPESLDVTVFERFVTVFGSFLGAFIDAAIEVNGGLEWLNFPPTDSDNLAECGHRVNGMVYFCLRKGEVMAGCFCFFLTVLILSNKWSTLSRHERGGSQAFHQDRCSANGIEPPCHPGLGETVPDDPSRPL
jgi:hypothetical protein